MPLPSSALLSPHFTAYELGADRPEATLTIVNNLRMVADTLERVRAVLGVPLQANTANHLNRGFRPPDSNIIAGGSPTSDHPRGLAGDIVPLGYAGGMLGAYNALRNAYDAGSLGPFDQIILYPIQGHIHVGIGERLRGEFRVYIYEGSGGIPLVSADTIKALGGRATLFITAHPLLSLLVVVVAIVLILPS